MAGSIQWTVFNWAFCICHSVNKERSKIIVIMFSYINTITMILDIYTNDKHNKLHCIRRAGIQKSIHQHQAAQRGRAGRSDRFGQGFRSIRQSPLSPKKEQWQGTVFRHRDTHKQHHRRGVQHHALPLLRYLEGKGPDAFRQLGLDRKSVV